MYGEIYPQVKSFTDKNGKKGKIGDNVRIWDIYDKVETEFVLKVVKAHKQGNNGTILHFDENPFNINLKHYTHRAKDVVIEK